MSTKITKKKKRRDLRIAADTPQIRTNQDFAHNGGANRPLHDKVRRRRPVSNKGETSTTEACLEAVTRTRRRMARAESRWSDEEVP